MDNTNKTNKPKYWVDLGKRKRFPIPLFKKIYMVDDSEVEKFLKRNKRLPEHVHRMEEKDEPES